MLFVATVTDDTTDDDDVKGDVELKIMMFVDNVVAIDDTDEEWVVADVAVAVVVVVVVVVAV